METLSFRRQGLEELASRFLGELGGVIIKINTFPACATRVAAVMEEALQADATMRFGMGIRIEGDESTLRLVKCAFFWGSVFGCCVLGFMLGRKQGGGVWGGGGAGTRIQRRWV